MADTPSESPSPAHMRSPDETRAILRDWFVNTIVREASQRRASIDNFREHGFEAFYSCFGSGKAMQNWPSDLEPLTRDDWRAIYAAVLKRGAN